MSTFIKIVAVILSVAFFATAAVAFIAGIIANNATNPSVAATATEIYECMDKVSDFLLIPSILLDILVFIIDLL